MPLPPARPRLALLPCLALLPLLVLLAAPGCVGLASRTARTMLPGSGDKAVPVWGRFEARFEAATAAPTTRLQVTFTAPSGAARTVDAFWDGGAVWRVRFMPDEAGAWTYRTTSVPSVDGLDGEQGGFESRPAPMADNPFLRHGAVQVAADGPYLAHADGTPFFWLGDTAWNGALRATESAWTTYLADRLRKGFTTVQFVTTQWRAAHADAEGRVAYTGFEEIEINPAFFQRMDARIDALNEAGLLAAPVLLWALGEPNEVPGKLPEDQAIRLARYLVARYGANHVVWLLGGDENYSGDRTDRWKRIGRAVFDGPAHAPVTLHPQGMQWHFDAFADEPWLDLLIYQSGHGDDAQALRWIHAGPPATKWREMPARPLINSEPPYEDHVAYQSRQPHSAYNVRRAVYWSLLNAPTAGVTYGAHGIWSWETEPAVPLNHARSGVAKPWNQALRLPGSMDMKHVADLFTAVAWWRLRPAPALVPQQPHPDDPARHVAAAATPDGGLALLYLPTGGSVRLNLGTLGPGLRSFWYDPRDGSRRPARRHEGDRFDAPDAQDWVLLFHP